MIFKYIDFIAFALSNLLLGTLASRSGGTAELATFAFSTSIALIVNGFFKSIVVNPFSISTRGVMRRYASGYICFVLFGWVAGVTLFFVDKFIIHENINLMRYLFLPLFFWYSAIDFSRIFYLRSFLSFRSGGLSLAFLSVVSVSVFLGEIGGVSRYVEIVFFSGILVSFFCVFNLWRLFDLSSGFVLIKRNFSLYAGYWLVNSMSIHLPIVILSYISATFTSSFFVLRTIYNSFSIVFRPLENSFRLRLAAGGNPIRFLYFDYGKIVILLSFLTAFLMVFGSSLINIFWPKSAEVGWEEFLSFFIYMALMWFFIMMEPVAVKIKLFGVFSRIKLFEMIYLAVVFSVFIYFDVYKLYIFVLSLSVPMVVGVCFLYWIGQRRRVTPMAGKK